MKRIVDKLIEKNKTYTQRELSSILKISVGSVNKTLAELTQNGYVSSGEITNENKINTI